MGDPSKLTGRQEMFIARAAAVTSAQLGAASVVIEEALGIQFTDQSMDMRLKVAQIIATNYHASLADNNSPPRS